MAMSLLVVRMFPGCQEELFYVEKQLRVYDVIRYPSGTRTRVMGHQTLHQAEARLKRNDKRGEMA